MEQRENEGKVERIWQLGEAALPSSHQPLNIKAPAADDGYTCKPFTVSRSLLAFLLKGSAVLLVVTTVVLFDGGRK